MVEWLVRFPHKKEQLGSNPSITTKYRELISQGAKRVC